MSDEIDLGKFGKWVDPDATKAMHADIVRHQVAEARKTARLISLTWAILVLTFLIAVWLIVLER
jgi:uncharacterized membrane protein YecN with MAPEG domain